MADIRKNYTRQGFSILRGEEACMQGVVKSFDPSSGDGVIMRDTDFAEIEIAPSALMGSMFRFLRQGQRIVFDLDEEGFATSLRLGSETDMGTPSHLR